MKNLYKIIKLLCSSKSYISSAKASGYEQWGGFLTHRQEVDVICEDIAKPPTRFSNVRSLLLTLKNALPLGWGGKTGCDKPMKTHSPFTIHYSPIKLFSFSPFKPKSHSLFPISYSLSPSPAFTLAEVLITLAIIGVVAAMTIPTLLSDIDKRDKYTGLQKALSTMSEVTARIRMENGNSMAGLATDNASFAALFKEYLKPIQICESSTDYEKCYLKSTDTVHELKGGTYYNSTNTLKYPKIVTADGFVYMFYLSDSSCSAEFYVRNNQKESCGGVFVDINGTKKPNTVGKDLFVISINKYNTTPYWNMQSTTYTPKTHCNESASSGTNYNGASCGARAILDGGIKYY